MQLKLSSFLKSLLFVYGSAKLTGWFVNYIINLYTYRNHKHLPILPLIGNLHLVHTAKMSRLQRVFNWSRQFHSAPMFIFWNTWKPIAIVHKAEVLEVVLAGSKNLEKDSNYRFIKPWLGEGLLTSKSDKWAQRRKIITPSFHNEILNEFIVVMNENIEILVKKLQKLASVNPVVDVYGPIGLCALDIICETAMGQNINAQQESELEYIKAVSDINTIVIKRQFNPFHSMDFIYNLTSDGRKHKKTIEILHKFTRDIIIKRSEEFDGSNFGTQKRVAFLDMLLKAKHVDNTLTFDDIQEEVDTFMFGGHDTTSTTAAWSLHFIGSHPHVQKQIHEELDKVFETSDRHLTSEDIGNLKYLECVIKESMRVMPVVPFLGRVMSEDAEIGDLKIRKGTNVSIFTYSIHRDERYFPEPDKFDPDRFLPENSRNRHPYAYLPFSVGKRNCIGQRFAMIEEKILLASIMRRFQVESVKTTEELKPTAEIVLKPKYGIPIRLNLRNK